MDDPHIRQVLAENLSALMEGRPELGSQPKLAAKSGVGQTTIGRILRRETDATIGNLQLLAKAFRIPAHELLRDGGPVMSRNNGSHQAESSPPSTGNLYVDLIVQECGRTASSHPERLSAALGILNGTLPLPSQPATNPELRPEVMEEVDRLLAEAGVKAELASQVTARILAFMERRIHNQGAPPGQPERRAKS